MCYNTHAFGIVSEIHETRQGESWTHHLCLGLTIFLLQKNNKECTSGTPDILVVTSQQVILHVCLLYLLSFIKLI